MKEPRASQPIVWLNGEFLPLDRAGISPLDRGFQHGDGLFETLRAEAGRPLYWRDHVDRLLASASFLRISMDPSPDWRGLLREILQRNRLTEVPARIKILVSRGVCEDPGLPRGCSPSLCVLAVPYLPPSPALYEKGWRLHVAQEGFSSPLSPHKTLSYLPFWTARQEALDRGADEAVLRDPAGMVTETSAGSILARSAGRWWTPEARLQLPGITLKQVRRLIEQAGKSVEARPCPEVELLSADTVWVLNSMVLVMPVSQIGKRPVANLELTEAASLREALLEEK